MHKALVFCLILLVAGCFGKSENGSGYWTRGCVLPDESTIAAVGSDAAVLDVNSGKTIRTIPGFFNDVVCLSDKRILALTPKEATDLSTQKTSKRTTAWNVVGPVYGNQILVSFRDSGGSTTMRSWNGPLKLSVENFDQSQIPEQILLTTDRFPLLGQGRENFLEAIPVRVLNNNSLLVAAGFSSTDQEKEKPWAFFKVDFKNGSTTMLGPLRKGDEDLSMFVKMTRFASTPDAHLVAGASGTTIVLMSSDQADSIGRLKLENIREIHQMRFNKEGTLLAAAVIDSNGNQGRIHVLDGRTGKQLWQTDYQKGVIYFIEFLRDDSLIIVRSNQGVSRLSGKDGAVRY